MKHLKPSPGNWLTQSGDVPFSERIFTNSVYYKESDDDDEPLYKEITDEEKTALEEQNKETEVETNQVNE